MFVTPNVLHSVYFTDHNIFLAIKMGTPRPMKSEFWPFSNWKMNVTSSSSSNNRKKMVFFVYFSWFSHGSLSLKCQKWSAFSISELKTAKHLSLVMAIYIVAPQSSCNVLSENGMFYKVLKYSLVNIEDWNIEKYADSAEFNKTFEN